MIEIKQYNKNLHNIENFIILNFIEESQKNKINSLLNIRTLFIVEKRDKITGLIFSKYFEDREVLSNLLYFNQSLEIDELDYFINFVNFQKDNTNGCKKIYLSNLPQSKNILSNFEAEIAGYKFIKEKFDKSMWIETKLPQNHSITYNCKNHTKIKDFFFQVFRESSEPILKDIIDDWIDAFFNKSNNLTEIVYKIDNEIIGVALGYLNEKNEHYLNLMGVDKNQRGKGIGKILLTEFEKYYPTKVHTLTTQNFRKSAMNTYLNFGYKISEVGMIECECLRRK